MQNKMSKLGYNLSPSPLHEKSKPQPQGFSEGDDIIETNG